MDAFGKLEREHLEPPEEEVEEEEYDNPEEWEPKENENDTM